MYGRTRNNGKTQAPTWAQMTGWTPPAIPGPQSLIIFYTAIITTFIAVLGIILLNKWSKKI